MPMLSTSSAFKVTPGVSASSLAAGLASSLLPQADSISSDAIARMPSLRINGSRGAAKQERAGRIMKVSGIRGLSCLDMTRATIAAHKFCQYFLGLGCVPGRRKGYFHRHAHPFRHAFGKNADARAV